MCIYSYIVIVLLLKIKKESSALDKIITFVNFSISNTFYIILFLNNFSTLSSNGVPFGPIILGD